MSAAPTTTKTAPNRTQEPPMTTTPIRARDLQVGQRILNRRTAEAWLIVKVEDVPGPRAFVKLTLESGEVVRRDRGDLFTVVPT